MSEPLERHEVVADSVDRAFRDGAFLAARGNCSPSVVLRGNDSGIVWANEAAARLFDAPDALALEKRLGSGRTSLVSRPGSSIGGRIGSAPRLERLRFTIGTRIRNLTALCTRFADTGADPIIVLAFIGPDAEAASRGLAWARPIPGLAAVSWPVARAALTSSTGGDDRGVVLVVDDAASADVGTSRDHLVAALGGATSGRFAWRTDAAGSIVQIDEAMLRRLGIPLVHDEQTTLAEQVSGFDPNAGTQIADAFSGGSTWGGIVASTPVLDGDVSLPVVFAAAPLFDADRRFRGFRGFARFNLVELESRAAPVPFVPSVPGIVAPAVVGETTAPILDLSPALAAGDGDVVSVALDDAAAATIRSKPRDGVAADGANDALAAYERAANVVRLRPVHPVAPARLALHLARPTPSSDGVTATPPTELVIEARDDEQRSRIDGAVGRNIEWSSTLTTTEQQAFQEIGRALGQAPRRSVIAASAPAAPRPVDIDAATIATEPDLNRNASALVEHMAAGLLVIRQKRVLFANDALRLALRFESHDELLDALALRFTLLSPPAVSDTRTILRLPSHYGEDLALSAVSRDIVWNGDGARLWTLTEADAAPSDASSGEEPAALPVEPESASVLDLAADAVAIADFTGRLLWWNQQAERAFGRQRDQACDVEFAHLLASESRPGAMAAFDRTKADGDPQTQIRLECLVRKADGGTGPFDIRMTRLGGERVGIVWRDLSAQRALEREIALARRQASRAGNQQPEFLATVSHQVRTPLNAILGFAEIMMDERFGPLGNPRYKDYLKDIHASGSQVISMIDDLMDLSRVEAGRLDLELGPVDLNKVIVDCVADAHALAHRERVIVRTSFGPRLPPIMADERSARQIIGNLLSNAIKFNEPGGQVIVSTASSDPTTVVVRIRDTGIGMSDGDIAAALEPFRQLAPTKNASGTGLGLPLTKALIGANGASLSMRSRPSEGTMVEVTFQASVPIPARVLA